MQSTEKVYRECLHSEVHFFVGYTAPTTTVLVLRSGARTEHGLLRHLPTCLRSKMLIISNCLGAYGDGSCEATLRIGLKPGKNSHAHEVRMAASSSGCVLPLLIRKIT